MIPHTYICRANPYGYALMMIAAAGRFNVDRVRQEDVAKIGGAPPAEEG